MGDRYDVEREIGRGGMAVVYLANDRKHGRRVAIKVMAPHVARMIGPAQFLREIEIAARLNHPHVLPLFDSGVTDGSLYYVMPFIEGESLRARLIRETRLSLVEAIRLTREIAGALHHAHLQGLVHRDIKPENVLLADGIPLVADFGIAFTRRDSKTSTRSVDAGETTSPPPAPREEGDNLGETLFFDALDISSESEASGTSGQTLGTPLYMAPEQAAGAANLDGRADQYALGCVFFELLAGEPPFQGSTLREILELHAHANPPDITTLRSDVPDDVVSALKRALAKDPADRYPAMTQFIEALNAAAVRAYAAAFREGNTSGIPNNLPLAATSFIGREKEMAEVKEILAKSRLVTLTGSGGTGKTRLAIQVATEALEQFPDGVWIEELAPLSDPALVPKAIATAMGIREAGGEPVTETITASIQGKKALLLLDNCEHVLDAVAQIAHRLLSTCPNLHVLTSSREALGVVGEVSYRVPSLALPAADRPATPENVLASPAARLFFERAMAGKPDFAVTSQNAPALAAICRRLDGVPLAIELAAARTRALAVEQIEARLDSRFRLLTGGSRTALPRQQTLQALIDWSYDLLKQPEKEMLSHLSVFSGGWTLESAEAVCSAEGIEEWEVLDLLTSLVDKSLVVYEESEGAARYRLLETVRQYARDRLLEEGATEEWRDRHLDHFLALAEEAAPHLVGRDQESWLPKLQIEYENLRAALDWSEGAEERHSKNLRLCGALQWFWFARGHFFEGRARLARALAQDPGGDLPRRAGALNGAANLAYAQGDYAGARPLHDESLGIRRVLNDRVGIATSLNNLASVSYFEGDLETAGARISESLAIRRELGDRAGISSCLNNLAMIAQKSEDYETARAHLAESLTLRREAGDSSGIAAALHNLGVIEMQQHDYDAARALWEESLSIRIEIGDRAGNAATLQTLGALALEQGDLVTARARFTDALHLSQELGMQLQIASSLEGLAPVAAQSGQHERAIRLFAAAARIREAIGAPAHPSEQELRDREIDEIRQAMSEQAFAAAWTAGRTLTAAELAAETEG